MTRDELRPEFVDEIRPAVPRGDELGRLNTPDHSRYMRECRWCGGPLDVHNGVLFCPPCDRLPNMTNGPTGWQAGVK